jgi:hypothetical protein
MNLEKIYVGLRFKNYKHMCEFLGIPVKVGKSKILQLEDLKRYFDFVKIGNSFEITKIYSTKLEKVDKRKAGNNSIYSKHLELIFLNYLYNNNVKPSNKIQLSTINIALITGMCNKRYAYKEHLDLIGYVTNFDIDDFYRRTGQKFHQLVKSLLRNLADRHILIVTKIFKIVENKRTRTASENDVLTINDIYKKALIMMDLKMESEVYTKFKHKEYYNNIKFICTNDYDWDNIYILYQISFTNKAVEDGIQEYSIEIEKDIHEKLLLNNKLCKFFDDQAIRIYNKNLNYLKDLAYLAFSEDEKYIQQYVDAFKHNKNYIQSQKTLCKFLIKE